MSNFDDLKMAVESLTKGKNTVLLDDIGLPSIMVVWDPLKNSALLDSGSDVYHPGSVVGGDPKRMYISKYQNVIMNERGYSLPMCDPETGVSYDRAVAVSRAKGRGWGLMPFSLWAQIALWCRKNVSPSYATSRSMPRGNNSYGRDWYSQEDREGTPTKISGGRIERIATGSGPITWNHNGLPDGIADLNGNVEEWCAGMRLMDGEIQVVPYANSMDPDVSLGASSTAWKAINAEGELVEPGTSGTLKYDWLSDKITLTTDAVSDEGTSNRGYYFRYLGIKSGLTAPEVARAMILYPDDYGGYYYGDEEISVKLAGEMVPRSGGSWLLNNKAGVFCTRFATRSSYGSDTGFRSVYCDLSGN